MQTRLKIVHQQIFKRLSPKAILEHYRVITAILRQDVATRQFCSWLDPAVTVSTAAGAFNKTAHTRVSQLVAIITVEKDDKCSYKETTHYIVGLIKSTAYPLHMQL